MASVLFTHSYFLRFDPKQWKQQQPYAPLGTMYAASVLREAGHHVSLFDTMFAHASDEINPYLEKHPDYLVIYDDGFNYLTKMCLTNMREAAFRMAQLAKEKGCKVIVCSSDAADHYEKYLDSGADFVILGEGEITLKELIEQLDKKANPETINGLVFRKDSKTIHSPKRDVLKDLDSLPMAAWDLIDIAPYKRAWKENWGYFSINVATTRGCPFKCNWCAKPIYGNRYNSRSPEKVVEEIVCLREHFQPDHIWFCDDIFGLKPGWVNAFADIMEQKRLKIKFKIQCRADLMMQENYVAALARAGCEIVWMGAESGSQKILDAMEKGTKVEQICGARKLLQKHGIKAAFFLQFGYPGEQMEDIQKTISMLLELLPDDLGISVSYPLPGTKFYENVKEQLNAKANWTDSDELALMFKNTYPPEFYKELHRFVHKIYRRKQATESIRHIVSEPFSTNGEEMRKALSILYYIPSSYLYKYRLKKHEIINA
jgi:anaerobic magnesium-protoporphyrin IX monomethyl ester cyclase